MRYKSLLVVLLFIVLLTTSVSLHCGWRYKDIFEVKQGTPILEGDLEHVDGKGLRINATLFNNTTWVVELIAYKELTFVLYVTPIGVVLEMGEERRAIPSDTPMELKVKANTLLHFESASQFQVIIDAVKLPQPPPAPSPLSAYVALATLIAIIVFLLVILFRPEFIRVPVRWIALFGLTVTGFSIAVALMYIPPSFVLWSVLAILGGIAGFFIMLLLTGKPHYIEDELGNTTDEEKQFLGTRFWYHKERREGDKVVLPLFPFREVVLLHGEFTEPYIRRFFDYIIIRGRIVRREKLGRFRERIYIEPYYPGKIRDYVVTAERANVEWAFGNIVFVQPYTRERKEEREKRKEEEGKIEYGEEEKVRFIEAGSFADIGAKATEIGADALLVYPLRRIIFKLQTEKEEEVKNAYEVLDTWFVKFETTERYIKPLDIIRTLEVLTSVAEAHDIERNTTMKLISKLSLKNIYAWLTALKVILTFSRLVETELINVLKYHIPRVEPAMRLAQAFGLVGLGQQIQDAMKKIAERTGDVLSMAISEITEELKKYLKMSQTLEKEEEKGGE